MKFFLVTLLAAAASAAFAPLHTAKERIDGSYIVVLNIRSMDIVKYVEEDGVYRTCAVASWGLDRIDQRVSSLNDNYSPSDGDGTGVHVYVIDTGIRRTHNDFGSRVGMGYDFVDDDFDASDCDGHGTHCAGTIGGSACGVAKGVYLYGVRVLNCFGSGYNSDIIAGVNYVKDEHLHFNRLQTSPTVASMSLGGGISFALDSAINSLVDAGVPTAVAAGNENTDACDSSPARCSSSITVGATATILQSDIRSSFSNYGKCVDIFAPGSDITSAWWTTDSATNTISGTSMACPHVAGAAAIALSEDPNLTSADIRSKLLDDATYDMVGDVKGSPNLLLYVGKKISL